MSRDLPVTCITKTSLTLDIHPGQWMCLPLLEQGIERIVKDRHQPASCIICCPLYAADLLAKQFHHQRNDSTFAACSGGQRCAQYEPTRTYLLHKRHEPATEHGDSACIGSIAESRAGHMKSRLLDVCSRGAGKLPPQSS